MANWRSHRETVHFLVQNGCEPSGPLQTNLGPPQWNPENNRRDKFLTNLRFGPFLNAVRGRRVRNKMGLWAFWHYKNKERVSKGLDMKWHIPSTCLDAPRKWFSTGIYSIKRAFEWLWLETQEAPLNGQNVHGFQARTPICHIVPVARAYPSPPPPWMV